MVVPQGATPSDPGLPAMTGAQRRQAPGGASGAASVAPDSWLPGPTPQPSGTAGPGPLALARSQGPATASSRHPQPAPVVARMVSDGPSPTARASVQTSGTTPGGVPVAGITATPVVQRVDGAAPAAPSGEDGRSETELDELARALFGRIRTHLRAEVIHEREAKGLTFDAF